MKPIPSCPACRQPFVDEDGRFSICKACPYRLPPKPPSGVPKVDWRAKYFKLLGEHTALLLERSQ